MIDETIETQAHTTPNGELNLRVNTGLADVDVRVTLHVRASQDAQQVDVNGWPIGYFERISGAIPEMNRGPQGAFEHRHTLE